MKKTIPEYWNLALGALTTGHLFFPCQSCRIHGKLTCTALSLRGSPNDRRRDLCKILLVVIIAVFLAVPAFSDPYSDAVAYWNLDETEGNILYDTADHAGGPYNGTNYGGTRVPGLLGNAIDFNGAYYATVGPSTLSDGWDKLTISCWVYIDNYASSAGIITSFYDYWELGSYLSSNNNVATCVNLEGDQWLGVASPSDSVQTGEWYHVVTRWESGEAIGITLDGDTTYSGSALTGVIDQGDYYKLGWDDYHSGIKLDGKVDEIAIWDRVLSDQEVMTLYSGGSGYSPTAVPEFPLFAMYIMVLLLTMGIKSYTYNLSQGECR